MLLVLPLLLPAAQFSSIQYKASAEPAAINLEIGHMVGQPARVYPPNYDLIKATNDQRVAAEAEAAHLEAVRAAEEAQTQQQAVQAAQVAYAAPTLPTGDAKTFIYMHESGNRPDAINPSSGACGLGQALPCSKMPCSLSDYACQDAFFTGYMQDRYGTWQNARAFWLANSWW